MDAYSPPTTNISISSLSTIFEQILCCTKIGQLFNIAIFPNVSNISWSYAENLKQFWVKILIKWVKMKVLVSLEFSNMQYWHEKFRKYCCRHVEFVDFSKNATLSTHKFHVLLKSWWTIFETFTPILHISDAN